MALNVVAIVVQSGCGSVMGSSFARVRVRAVASEAARAAARPRYSPKNASTSLMVLKHT